LATVRNVAPVIYSVRTVGCSKDSVKKPIAIKRGRKDIGVTNDRL
jgi:hypothetical protein